MSSVSEWAGLEAFIRAMPKVELHVHLEGSVRPATLLKLARQSGTPIPADDEASLRAWYRFTDFEHFIEVYLMVCKCICTPDDIELIAREFLAGQAEQNIRYSEVTYTAYAHYRDRGLPFEDQLAALNRARAWGESELGVSMGLVIDIPRSISPEEGLLSADWAISGYGRGVVAFGIGGSERGNPPSKFADSFARVKAAGVPSVPHAGEVVGPESIWDALDAGNAVRIGHGIRCLEDPALVAELRASRIPLEVSPTSNVCLRAVPSFEQHPLPRLIAEGLVVTLNSDDPPMFNTTLTDEFLKSSRAFGFGADDFERLTLDALRVSFLPPGRRSQMEAAFTREFARLRAQLI